MIQEGFKAIVPEVRLREGEITVKEAVRRLEVPVCLAIGSVCRLVGWSYDASNGFDALTNPNVIRTSLTIKYGLLAAVGALYLAEPDSKSREKLGNGITKAANAVRVAYSVSKKLIKGGEPHSHTRRGILKNIAARTATHFDHTGQVPYGLQLARKGVETNFKIAWWGLRTVRNVAKLGWRSGGEVVDIGSKIWFVNRGLHVLDSLDPLATVYAPGEFEDHVLHGAEIPSEWKADAVRFRRVH
jgi:hypothetical protein